MKWTISYLISDFHNIDAMKRQPPRIQIKDGIILEVL